MPVRLPNRRFGHPPDAGHLTEGLRSTEPDFRSTEPDLRSTEPGFAHDDHPAYSKITVPNGGNVISAEWSRPWCGIASAWTPP